MPDIDLVPTRVTTERVNVFAPRKSMGEADLEQHFGNSANGPVAKKREDVIGREKSLFSLKYLKEDVQGRTRAPRRSCSRRASRRRPSSSARTRRPASRTARRRIRCWTWTWRARARTWTTSWTPRPGRDQGGLRGPLRPRLRAPGALRQPGQDARARQGLRGAEAPGGGRAHRIGASPRWAWTGARAPPRRTCSSPPPSPGRGQPVEAGDLLALKVTVENRGAEPLKRVRACTESENPFLDRREFVFGALKPG